VRARGGRGRNTPAQPSTSPQARYPSTNVNSDKGDSDVLSGSDEDVGFSVSETDTGWESAGEEDIALAMYGEAQCEESASDADDEYGASLLHAGVPEEDVAKARLERRQARAERRAARLRELETTYESRPRLRGLLTDITCCRRSAQEQPELLATRL
jgi:hypothetical protein